MFSCLYKILIDGTKSNKTLESLFTILAKSSVLWFASIILLTETEIRNKLICFRFPLDIFSPSTSQIEYTNSSDRKISKSKIAHI